LRRVIDQGMLAIIHELLRLGSDGLGLSVYLNALGLGIEHLVPPALEVAARHSDVFSSQLGFSA
jgi:hypothetical protein